jgi:hypothetical protein
MSDIQWPFVRLEYAGIGNPRFVSDIVAANQAVLDSLAGIAGLGATDFAIFSGFTFIPGSPNKYSGGIFFFHGNWYYQATQFNELLYLTPAPQNIMSKPFSDSISRFIYKVQYSTTTSSAGGNTPQFSGNMNQYRLDLKSMGANILLLLAATTLNVIISGSKATLGAVYTVDFKNDQSIFCNVATVDTSITFDFTSAIPGAVVRLQWTWGGGRTLTVTQPAGSIILLDSGDPTRAAGYTNVMYFAYVGKDGSGNNVVSYTISQS